jgi:hypothetical protein
MEGLMSEDRLLQIFLSQSQTPGPAVFEVSVKHNGGLYCTCPGFRGRSTCKHVKFVKARVNHNNGVYPLEISEKASQEDSEKAGESKEAFRDFIIKYGKIEVF